MIAIRQLFCESNFTNPIIALDKLIAILVLFFWLTLNILHKPILNLLADLDLSRNPVQIRGILSNIISIQSFILLN